MSEHIDIKIKSWGNGSSSGPWVRVDLADDESLEKLKSQVGNGFHMILVPIDHGEPQKEVAAVDTVIEPQKKKGMKLSNEAHMMISEESFSNYLYSLDGFDSNYNSSQCDAWLKHICGIRSKSELDNPENCWAVQQFIEIRDGWRTFVNGG